MKLERYNLQTTNRPISVVKYWRDAGEMVLDAPYQRGHVWGETRQRNLIKSLILGIPIPSIIINDRAGAGWDMEHSCVVIDGKQRITAMLKFFDNELKVHGEWFGFEGDLTFEEISKKDISIKRHLEMSITIGFSEGKLPSLEQEQEVFDLVNFGGVPQGESDI
jgi:uncharacterized protein with ParB-like and HNH nuclease domain